MPGVVNKIARSEAIRLDLGGVSASRTLGRMRGGLLQSLGFLADLRQQLRGQCGIAFEGGGALAVGINPIEQIAHSGGARGISRCGSQINPSEAGDWV
jgi:hypothetical protein